MTTIENRGLSRIKGATSEVLGAVASKITVDSLVIPTFFEAAHRLHILGHAQEAMEAAQTWAAWYVSPELQWTQVIGAGLVAASVADRAARRPGRPLEAFVVGASLLVTPQVLMHLLDHPNAVGGLALVVAGAETIRFGKRFLHKKQAISETPKLPLESDPIEPADRFKIPTDPMLGDSRERRRATLRGKATSQLAQFKKYYARYIDPKTVDRIERNYPSHAEGFRNKLLNIQGLELHIKQLFEQGKEEEGQRWINQYEAEVHQLIQWLDLGW